MMSPEFITEGGYMITYIAVIVPVVLAIISGITFIAYKHPKGYKKILTAITTPLVVVVTSIIASNVGGIVITANQLSWQLAKRPDEKITDLSIYINNLQNSVNYAGLTIMVALCVAGYLTFLYFLPDILGLDKK
jgi:hypothetical protein